ncbi:TRAP transporter small permease [Brevibacterium sp. BRM-1]|uniref:TRAP transporter small permease n=1 Tax=Brevibacterium sp. BRM-1 TaxID=2999062 RepID=UPI002282DE27|nr:TRAP transporter small permease [Brevibacterium sp. BRM-1]WAL39783.1 TRAP transporter small permease [Brevibacterium sp. BRM-1]
MLDVMLRWTENVLAAGTLAGACILAIVAVLLRNITGDVIFWSEEAIIYLIIYSTFFGAVVALRHNDHVNVDILPVLLRGWARKILVLIGILMSIVYAFFLSLLSWQLVAEPFSRVTQTAALKMPLWVFELSLSIGMTLFFLRAIEMLIRALRTPSDELIADPADEFAAEMADGPTGLGDDVDRGVSDGKGEHRHG